MRHTYNELVGPETDFFDLGAASVAQRVDAIVCTLQKQGVTHVSLAADEIVCLQSVCWLSGPHRWRIRFPTLDKVCNDMMIVYIPIRTIVNSWHSYFPGDMSREQ